MSDLVNPRINTNELAEKLRERIRGTIGELIPEEQWTALMRAEITRFLSPATEGSTFYSRTTPSGFQVVAEQVIADEVRARLKKYLDDSPEWKARWDANGGIDCIPKRLEEMIERNLPVLMRECVVNLIAGISQKATIDSVTAVEQRMHGR